ncbi:rhodanese-like domain-containing protein [Dissulfurirhabdus thermomarina]|uniref:rhodanese-like domain-containing protein n=1 Tax=Dissulfurirhabdus thermomarina TaxID=1765737 RepID=UPI0014703693|nr:rhodanese-like domain-containing protein [Dissulfurirhabdus thermomarina]
MTTAAAVALVAALTVGWDLGWWAAGVRPLSPRQVERLEGAWLVDVRTPGEFAWRHVPGAENLPGGRGLTAAAAAHPKDRPVVVICFSGHRSPFAALRLRRAGFQRVYNLTGGMAGYLAWKALSR